jgi:GT2 family glycosyltransferase
MEPEASDLGAGWAAWRGGWHRGEVLPWRLSRLGGPLNTLLLVHLRRLRLRAATRASDRREPDDVTVIIGHRNRADYRLRNAVRSVLAQDYQGGRVSALIVDYGSDPEQEARVRALAAELGAELLAAGPRPIWNRSHCLNLGIRHSTAKFVMLSDVDVILAGNFVAEAVAALKANPLGMVYAQSLQLEAECQAELERAAHGPDWIDRGALRLRATYRAEGPFSTGMVLARRSAFERIRGYDEFYEVYGAEDTDLLERFEWLGLVPLSIADRSYYLHQWHPRHEGVSPEDYQRAVARNLAYRRASSAIRRNPRGWGEAAGPAR